MRTALQTIEDAARRLGYRQEAILQDYPFSDFSSSQAVARRVPLAVFTQTPASYRSAAFGVACEGKDGAEATVRANAQLGAPLFFLISDQRVTVWQVRAGASPRMIHSTTAENLQTFFLERVDVLTPEAIHRAKSIGRLEPIYQLDFVDAGLMPAIEGQIHEKLDHLLTDALSSTAVGEALFDARGVFQGVFRLLAAKVLLDRGHNAIRSWDPGDVRSVLDGIGSFYGLPLGADLDRLTETLRPAWTALLKGISVANISADDLAFVYENTLVTPETRQMFGTHSTPRHVAEYIVSRLGLWRSGEELPEVYEPFTGAGVFLVSALRHMREALPTGWSDKERHDLLVRKISGSEIDSFACEVATLSLILADYPNTNGWKIENTDLFENGTLYKRLTRAKVVLCNPPFEAFNAEQRSQYPEVAAVSGAQAEAVLMLALRAGPEALGFVLPRSFLLDRAYREHRRFIEKTYREVELVSLPDGMFNVSQVETALLIARDRAQKPEVDQVVRAGEVDDRDRVRFKKTGETSRVREVRRPMPIDDDGALWIPPLGPLWQRLAGLPTLGTMLEAHWGIRWLDGRQSTAASHEPGPNKAPGLMSASDHRQFRLGRPTFLDVEPLHLYGAGDLPWDEPKIILNAVRLSRGRWRWAAAVDRSGLRASQQFAVLWPKPGVDVDLDAIVAVLNSPIGNAFLDDHNSDRRIRLTTVLKTPLPRATPSFLGDLARQYALALATPFDRLSYDTDLAEILNEIDATVLDAFDLPPRLVRSLLSSFEGSDRPVAHGWQPWRVSEDDPALTLDELRNRHFAKTHRNWLKDELSPLPEHEARQIAPFFL